MARDCTRVIILAKGSSLCVTILAKGIVPLCHNFGEGDRPYVSHFWRGAVVPPVPGCHGLGKGLFPVCCTSGKGLFPVCCTFGKGLFPVCCTSGKGQGAHTNCTDHQSALLCQPFARSSPAPAVVPGRALPFLPAGRWPHASTEIQGRYSAATATAA